MQAGKKKEIQNLYQCAQLQSSFFLCLSVICHKVFLPCSFPLQHMDSTLHSSLSHSAIYYFVCLCVFCPLGLEKDGVHQPYNDTGDVDFYESKPDSLLMVYKTSAFRFFLSYSKPTLASQSLHYKRNLTHPLPTAKRKGHT